MAMIGNRIIVLKTQLKWSIFKPNGYEYRVNQGNRVILKMIGFWSEKSQLDEISTAQNGKYAEKWSGACFYPSYFILQLCSSSTSARFADMLNKSDGATWYYHVQIPPNKICHGHAVKAPKIENNPFCLVSRLLQVTIFFMNFFIVEFCSQWKGEVKEGLPG